VGRVGHTVHATSAIPPKASHKRTWLMSLKGHFETHAPQQTASYSITSSARSSNDGSTVRPSALAVLRFITSSNLVGP
jgi:hypothetical protein